MGFNGVSKGLSETAVWSVEGVLTIVPLSLFSVYTRDVCHAAWMVKGKFVPMYATKPYMGSRGVPPARGFVWV